MICRSTDCLVVLLAFTSYVHGQDLFLNSPCNLPDGSSGVCKAIGECQAARDDLKKGVRPKVCYYDRNLPIICCKSQQGNTPSAIRKSWQKCQEYAKSVYVEKASHSLSFASSTDLVNTCAQLRHGLIVNGVKSELNEYPHMVALGYGNENRIDWQCGGSLISEQFVLTAAHCLGSRSDPVRWARVGDLNLASQRDDRNAQQVEIIERIPHPSYRSTSKYDDIALVRLKLNVSFSPSVRPACITTNNPLPDGKVVIATGWGKLEWTSDEGSDDLMKVDLFIVPNRECNTKYAAIAKTSLLSRGITDKTMFCAGDAKNMRDTCSGDSGGPLQTVLEAPYCMYSIDGITSFGSTACGEFGTPAIYTRVSNYVEWIESKVWS